MFRCARLPANAIIPPRSALPVRAIPSRSYVPSSRAVSRSLSTKRSTLRTEQSPKRSWVSSRTPVLNRMVLPRVHPRHLSTIRTFPSPVSPSVPLIPMSSSPIFVPKDPNENRPDKEVSTDTLLQNLGFRQFLSRTYAWTGLGLCGTLGVATLLGPVGLSMPLFIGGIVTSFASIFGLSWLKPEFKKKTDHGKEILYAEDSLARKLSFVGLTGGMGVAMAPMIQMVLSIDPMIVPVSLGLTASIFGGCWLYSKKCTDLSMMKWKFPLLIGLCSLVGLQLIGLGSMWFFGPNAISALIHSVDLYGGIVLFVLLTIYDMHKASKMYRKGKPDHLGCATNLYLDGLNLIVRIMQIMAEAKKAVD